jgi:hypothetical protein
MLQDSTQTVNANIVFDHNLVVNDNIFMRNPTINHINLNVLNNNTVKLDEPTLLIGQIQFIGPVVSGGEDQVFDSQLFSFELCFKYFDFQVISN